MFGEAKPIRTNWRPTAPMPEAQRAALERDASARRLPDSEFADDPDVIAAQADADAKVKPLRHRSR